MLNFKYSVLFNHHIFSCYSIFLWSALSSVRIYWNCLDWVTKIKYAYLWTQLCIYLDKFLLHLFRDHWDMVQWDPANSGAWLMCSSNFPAINCVHLFLLTVTGVVPSVLIQHSLWVLYISLGICTHDLFIKLHPYFHLH